MLNMACQCINTNPSSWVTSVIPGSLATKQRGIEAADIIEEVNGKKVSTIEALRSAVRDSLQAGYLTFQSPLNIMVVLPFKQVHAQEQQLSEKLKYQISPFMKELMAAKK